LLFHSNLGQAISSRINSYRLLHCLGFNNKITERLNDTDNMLTV